MLALTMKMVDDCFVQLHSGEYNLPCLRMNVSQLYIQKKTLMEYLLIFLKAVSHFSSNEESNCNRLSLRPWIQISLKIRKAVKTSKRVLLQTS